MINPLPIILIIGGIIFAYWLGRRMGRNALQNSIEDARVTKAQRRAELKKAREAKKADEEKEAA